MDKWRNWSEKQDCMKHDLDVTDTRKRIWQAEQDHVRSFGSEPSLNVGAGNSPIPATISCDPLVPRNVICVAENLPFRSNVFRSVMFYSVLDHLKDDFVSLQEAKRVLMPKGRILIMQSVFDQSFRFKIKRVIWLMIHGKIRQVFYDPYSLLRVPWWDANHMRHYSSKTLLELFWSIEMREIVFATTDLGSHVVFGVFTSHHDDRTHK